MPRFLIELLHDHLPGARDPLQSPHPWYVLMEISSGRGDDDARELMEQALAAGLEEGNVSDATIAASLDQARLFWRMRHGVSEIQKHAGGSIKHDVSVAAERVPAFIEQGSAAIAALIPKTIAVPFGHLGDGNIHFNFTQPPGMDPPAFMARAPEVHAILNGIVVEFGGSIAAEHGIGRYKRELLKGVKKATFKYALGDEFIQAMEVFKSVNMHKTGKIRVGGVEVSPRDVIEAAAPDPNEIGKKYVGQTCAGTWVKGRRDDLEREVYLYQVADNEECVARYGTQGVVAQTAFTGVIAMELLALGKLAGHKGNPEAGVRVPQEFDADDFVQLMADYEFPGGLLEMDSPYKRAEDRAALTRPVLWGVRPAFGQ